MYQMSVIQFMEINSGEGSFYASNHIYRDRYDAHRSYPLSTINITEDEVDLYYGLGHEDISF